MAKAFSIKILGDKKLQKKLDKLSKRVQGPLIKDAARAAMEPVKDLARAHAPVLTGSLKKSIGIGTFSRKGRIGAVVRTGTRRQLKIPPEAPYYYPAAIEYGTRKLTANPFMRSALFARKGKALNIFRSYLKRVLEK